MRLNRANVVLILLLFLIVLGTVAGRAFQDRFGVTPPRVGEPRVRPADKKSVDSLQMEPRKPSDTPLSTSSDKLMLQSSAQNASLNSVTAEGEKTATALLAMADEAILAARYEYAATILQELVNNQGQQADARVWLKLGLCRETLGDQFAALRSYGQVVDRTYSPELTCAAELGRCRVWTATRRPQTAQSTLYTRLLGLQSIRSDKLRSRVVHQLAASAVHSYLQSNADDLLPWDRQIHLPYEEIVPEACLSEFVLSESRRSVPEEADLPKTKVLKLGQEASAIHYDVDFPPVSISEFLVSLAKAGEWKLQIDAKASKVCESHTISPEFRGIPLSLVLDAVLTPLEVEWSQQENEIHILSRENEWGLVSADQVERLLKHAIVSAPDHPLVSFSQMSLAAMHESRGAHQEAITAYQQLLDRFPKIPFADQVWLNIGKCRLALGKSDALMAFQKAEDCGKGGEIEVLAHAYMARIHLEDAHPEKAEQILQRAENLADAGPLRENICLLRASALLINGAPSQAALLLDRCGEVPVEATMRNEFALLAGLTRFQLERTSELSTQSRASLLAAAVNLDEQKAFGKHWILLKSEAYRLLGFLEEAEMLEKRIPSQLTNSVRQLREPLPATQRESGSSNKSRVEHSETVLTERNAPEQIEHYLAQLASSELTPEQRRDLLQRLGEMFQRRGQHELAIQCFTNSLDAKLLGNISP